MEVIGADGTVYDMDDVDGDVMGFDDEDDVDGDVMGYAGPMGDFGGSAIVGYDDDGDPIIVGRRRRRRKKRRSARHGISVVKPSWRRSQLAPGVIAPDQGMLPLPMGNQTFTATNLNITFEGQIQKPFRGERLLVTTQRTGTTAVGRILGQLFVGTDLAQLDVPAFDIEQVGDPNAFGVRLAIKPAQPGVFIRLVTTLSTPVTGTDTIFVSCTLLGRNVG